MIDNFQAKYDFAPDDYCTGVEYSDSTLPDLLARHVTNTSSTLQFKKSDSPIGCILPQPHDNDIWVKMQPNNDGTETVWWYSENGFKMYYDIVHEISSTGLNNNSYNYIELQDITSYSINPFDDIESIIENGAVLDVTGFSTPNMQSINFDDFQGTLTGLTSLNTSRVQSVNFSDHCIFPSLDLSGWDMSNCLDLDMGYTVTTNRKINLSGWNVGTHVGLLSLFNSLEMDEIDVSNWNLENSTSLSYLFSHINDISKYKGLETWNVSNITDFSSLIDECSGGDVNLSRWDVSSATTLSGTFDNFTGYEESEQHYYRASLNLSYWVIPNNPMSTDDSGYYMYNPFVSGLPDMINVSNWDFSNATNISGLMTGLYSSNEEVVKIYGLSTWDVSNITNMSYLFESSSIEPIGLQNWDIESVTNFDGMFKNTEGVASCTVTPEGKYTYTTDGDFTRLNSWRTHINPNASFNHMFGYRERIESGYFTFPEWNGWFDRRGTFIPYTGNEIPNGIYFKGIGNMWEDLPENPSTGDAYNCYAEPGSSGYYSGYYAYNGSTWLQIMPHTTPTGERLEEGYYLRSCDDEWEIYSINQVNDGCGDYTNGEIMSFYQRPASSYYIGEYQWNDGSGYWYKIPEQT